MRRTTRRAGTIGGAGARGDVGSRLLFFASGAGTAWVLGFINKRRRHIARDRAAATVRSGVAQAQTGAQDVSNRLRGAAHEATRALRHDERTYDDVTLARKVESELFRPPDAPKGSVSINVQHGVVELRGQVDRPEQVEALAQAAGKVEGVERVHNLLHTPGSPPKHSPPSDPQEVRDRAAEHRPESRFARNPATTPGEDEPLVERAPQSGHGEV